MIYLVSMQKDILLSLPYGNIAPMRVDSGRTQVQSICLAAVLVILQGIFAGNAFSQSSYQVYGLDFSPYLTGQQPGTQITAAQIQARLAVVAPYTKWVRTYSSLNGLEQICPIAHSLGLKCAAGATINGTSTDGKELASLVSLAKAGVVDLAIVGTEALTRNNVSLVTLGGYISQVKIAAPAVPVTTADTYQVWMDNKGLFSIVDTAILDLAPFYEGIPLAHAASWVNGWYQLVQNAAGSKQIIISETGWPTSGAAVGSAVPSVANSSSYFLNFVSWARANNVPFFYLEAFDESWKVSEHPQGPFFGLWDAAGTIKAGMSAVFQGKQLTDNWSGNDIPGGAGTPSITLSYAPPYGSASNRVFGRVLHVRPADYKIACYVLNGVIWYEQPSYTRPLVPILDDGTWSCDVDVTAGVTAFVVPNGNGVPSNIYGNPPTSAPKGAIANASTLRTSYSVSGVVKDSAGNGMDGVTVSLSGSGDGVTQTANGGQYSFLSLSPGGNYVVTPSLTGAVFSPASQSVPNVLTPQTANFSAVVKLLTISGHIADKDGSALSGVSVSLTGASSTTKSVVTTDLFGNYTFSGLTPGSSFVVQPSAAGYSFLPPSQTLASLTSDTAANFVRTSAVLGDSNGDGVPDLLWQNDTTRDVTVWFMGGPHGSTQLSQTVIGTTPGWTLRAAADLNGDGVPDLLWQNDTTRQVTVWFMGGPQGSTQLSQTVIGITPGWTLRAAADMNRDGVPDLLWQNDTTRDVTVWFMGGPQGSTQLSQTVIGITPGWTLRAAADMNRDGVPDLLWQNDTTRDVTVWFMGGPQGSTYLSQNYIGATPGWSLRRALDMNSDGVPDLFWQSDITRDVTIWFMGGAQGSTYLTQNYVGVTPGWQLVNH